MISFVVQHLEVKYMNRFKILWKHDIKTNYSNQSQEPILVHRTTRNSNIEQKRLVKPIGLHFFYNVFFSFNA